MKKIILPAIFILGFLLRVIFINSSPPSLYGDELTIALDANSLLKTGHDQLGNFLPLTFPMGAGRPAGYVYGSIPFVALFGPSALGVRTLSILSGLGIIILLYYIGKKLFSEKIGLIAALLTSVSLWDISLSRGGFEAHFALFLALLGFYLFIKAREKPILYILSALSFGLTWHTYPTYKISLILFLPLMVYFLGVNKKNLFTPIIVLAILGILALSQTFIGGSETRFSDINIFSQAKIKDSIEQKINFERNITKLPNFFSKYFHNKGVEYTKVLVENYLQNFSMDFLILHGDRNPRHNMATMGEIYFVDLILIGFGILNSFLKQKKIIILLLFWILLAPIPTAIVDSPHALRSAFMLPPLLILSALGLMVLLEQKKKRLIYLFGVLFIIQFVFFTQKLYFLAPKEYSNFWSYQAKLASEKVLKNKDSYDYIFLSDRIDSMEFAYPVYAKIDPVKIIEQNRNKVKLNSYFFKKFDNVYISSIPESEIESFLKGLQGNILYIWVDNLNNLVLTKKVYKNKIF